jgi:hypothetical protein
MSDSIRAVAPPGDQRFTLRDAAELLPGVYYMDPPDGGDVSVIEQLRRMVRDAARYRWLCANNFDGIGVTQVHTWLQTWEPHSQTGEPTEWTQRVRGGRLDAVIDAEMARASDRYPKGQDPQGLGGAAIERGPKDAPKTCKNRSEDAPPSEP